MTQEEKQLLLVDLCARLPYGVKFYIESWNYEWDQEMSVVEILEDIDKNGFINNSKVYNVEDIKPYLRPMSSMTEEEKKEYELLGHHCMCTAMGFVELEAQELIDWCNKCHFDYRHLIPKGLAFEAPEGMYGKEDEK